MFMEIWQRNCILNRRDVSNRINEETISRTWKRNIKNAAPVWTTGAACRKPSTNHHRGSLPFYGITTPPNLQGGLSMNCKKCKSDMPDGAMFCPACGVRQVPAPRKPKSRGNGMGPACKRGNGWIATKTLR